VGRWSDFLDLSLSACTGPVLIAPLSDADRAKELQVLVKELSAYSRRARRHRLAR
jgi:hypothetical protein